MAVHNTAEPAAPSPARLQGGVLTVPNAAALSAAAMAPVLAVVLNAPAAAGAAGAALPLSFLIAFIAAALVGNTVVQFARQLPSAGSFYTFNSRGLGPVGGFFTGWRFWIGYAVLEPGLFSAFRGLRAGLRPLDVRRRDYSGGSSASRRWPSSWACPCAASRHWSAWTARDAMFNDYYVVVAEDCVASDDPEQHEASMLLMRHRFDIAGSHDITAEWASPAANTTKEPTWASSTVG